LNVSQEFAACLLYARLEERASVLAVCVRETDNNQTSKQTNKQMNKGTFQLVGSGIHRRITGENLSRELT
jgi:hypothetical protein